MDLTSLWVVFFAAAVLIGIAVLAMAIGVIFRRPCLRGSCGGEAIRGPDGTPLSCESCPRRAAADSH
jgi:hypothetical protein